MTVDVIYKIYIFHFISTLSSNHKEKHGVKAGTR